MWELEADKIWDSLFDFMDFDFQPDYSVSTLKDNCLPTQTAALQTRPVIRKSSCASAISPLIARNKDSAISAQLALASDAWGKVKTSSAILSPLSHRDRALVKARQLLGRLHLPHITGVGGFSGSGQKCSLLDSALSLGAGDVTKLKGEHWVKWLLCLPLATVSDIFRTRVQQLYPWPSGWRLRKPLHSSKRTSSGCKLKTQGFGVYLCCNLSMDCAISKKWFTKSSNFLNHPHELYLDLAESTVGSQQLPRAPLFLKHLHAAWVCLLALHEHA